MKIERNQEGGSDKGGEEKGTEPVKKNARSAQRNSRVGNKGVHDVARRQRPPGWGCGKKTCKAEYGRTSNNQGI